MDGCDVKTIEDLCHYCGEYKMGLVDDRTVYVHENSLGICSSINFIAEHHLAEEMPF